MSGSDIQREVAAGINEAAQALSDGGFSITIVSGAAQPVNPWDAPAGSPTETPVIGIVSNYPRKLIDGTLIRAEDRKILIGATGINPTVADKVKIATLEYEIVSVMELAPAGVPLTYEIQARR